MKQKNTVLLRSDFMGKLELGGGRDPAELEILQLLLSLERNNV